MARKILLADDSVTAQNMGRKILADAGYEVVTVNNGSAALKRIHELKPDLVVLDIYMPGYSGLEVCQILKSASETAHIPVLLSVGKLEPFKPDEARRVRADAHIVKPFEASELLKALEQLADRMLPASELSSKPAAPAAPIPATRLKTETASKEAAASNEVASSAEDTSGAKHLRLSAKKTKEQEKTGSTDGIDGTFHDFRSVPATANQSTTANQTEVAGGGETEQTGSQQSGAERAPDIPNDITPDELDALSALVARLEAPRTSEKAATPAAKTSESRTPERVDPVNVTQFAQEPASIDQQDEPIFAVTEYTGSQSKPKVAEGVTAKAPLTGGTAEAAKAEEPKALEFASEQARLEPSLAESLKSQGTEFQVSEAETHVAAADSNSVNPVESGLQTNLVTGQASEAEQGAYGEIKPRDVEAGDERSSEEELAEALQALKQIGGRVGSPIHPMEMRPMEMPAVLSPSLSNDDEARAASPRWTAEPVPVETEEAAASLEAEMFAGLANKAAQEALSAPGRMVEGTTVEGTIVEAAMSADEPPKAKAAAATAEGASSALADAGTVANIVDRVLADLRPKIVEEITRKLSGK